MSGTLTHTVKGRLTPAEVTAVMAALPEGAWLTVISFLSNNEHPARPTHELKLAFESQPEIAPPLCVPETTSLYAWTKSQESQESEKP